MKTPQTPDGLDAAALKVAAVDLLSRREHSRRELQQKLLSRAASADDLYTILDELAERGWQSDQRYVGSYIRTKCLRNIGPVRLFQELRQKGVAESLIRESIEEAEFDWFEMARDAALKKASGLNLADQKDKAKIYRFLAYRGFNSDQIQYALEECRKTTEA